MFIKSTLSVLALAGTLVAAHASAAPSPDAALLARASISKEQATRTALARVPNGHVGSAELEREHGRLIWSFDVAQAGRSGVTEVQVDARSGKIVSIQKESAAHEASETRAEAQGR
jgi:uncharacterized membrane protein YkoI